MRRIAVRRRASDDAPLVVLGAAAGFAAGAVLGFVLGEAGTPRLRPRPGALRGVPLGRAVARRVADARRALDDDLLLHDAHLEVLAAGRTRIELHGWVDDRATRTRAGRLAARAVPDRIVVNCVLVRGEDDVDADLDESPGSDADADADALPA